MPTAAGSRTASIPCSSPTGRSSRRSPMASPAVRPEYVREQVDEHDFGVINKPLTAWERVYGNALVRKTFILVVLAAIWQAYASHLDNQLLFPTFVDTIRSFLSRFASGELAVKSWTDRKSTRLNS